MTNWKSLLQLAMVNAIVLAVLLLVVLGAAEAYLRFSIPSSSGGSIFESTLATKRYKVMKRNYRIIAYGSEFRTNDLGFRDNRRTIPPKAPGAYRIIVLGDSFTAAMGTDFERIYTSLLQDQLRKTSPDVEVLNLAVGGYNPIQEELVLKEVGFSLQPDLVVAAMFPANDLFNDTYKANYDEAMGRVVPVSRPWYANLYIYQAFLRRVEIRIRGMLAKPAVQPAVSDGSAEREAEENLTALERTVDAATNAGLGVVVVLLPNTEQFDAQRSQFAPFVERCEAHHWDCLNLLDSFIASGEKPSALRLNVLDHHLNERYNALAAFAIAAHLKPLVDVHVSAAVSGGAWVR